MLRSAGRASKHADARCRTGGASDYHNILIHLEDFFFSDIRSSCKAKGRGVIFSAPSKVR